MGAAEDNMKALQVTVAHLQAEIKRLRDKYEPGQHKDEPYVPTTDPRDTELDKEVDEFIDLWESEERRLRYNGLEE